MNAKNKIRELVELIVEQVTKVVQRERYPEYDTAFLQEMADRIARKVLGGAASDIKFKIIIRAKLSPYAEKHGALGAHEGKKGGWHMILVRRPESYSSLGTVAETIAHEMTHALQEHEGRLETHYQDWTWEGEHFDKDSDYRSSPWEQEAEASEQLGVDVLKEMEAEGKLQKSKSQAFRDDLYGGSPTVAELGKMSPEELDAYLKVIRSTLNEQHVRGNHKLRGPFYHGTSSKFDFKKDFDFASGVGVIYLFANKNIEGGVSYARHIGADASQSKSYLYEVYLKPSANIVDLTVWNETTQGLAALFDADEPEPRYSIEKKWQAFVNCTQKEGMLCVFDLLDYNEELVQAMKAKGINGLYFVDGLDEIKFSTGGPNVPAIVLFDTDVIGNVVVYEVDVKGGEYQEITENSNKVLERLIESTMAEILFKAKKQK